VDQKEKMPSYYHFRILFASKESKQDYVSLILFRIIPFTYASHSTKQWLLLLMFIPYGDRHVGLAYYSM
jgi:hypothetical protein